MDEDNHKPQCSNNGCSRPLYAKGLCKTCYNKKLRDETPKRVCSAKGCERSAQTGRYCASHYRRRRNGQMGLPIRGHNQVGCLIDNCDGEHHGLGLCYRHWRGGRVDPDKRLQPSYNPSNRNLLYKYRISQVERDQMFAGQGDVCACCHVQPPTQVDHDHGHGCSDDPKRGCRDCVRGGLCSSCNTALEISESAAWRAMADIYLARPRPFAGTPDPTASRIPKKPFAEELALLKELGLR